MSRPARRWQPWALGALALVVVIWWAWPLAQTAWWGLPELSSLARGEGRLALRNTVVWLVVVPAGSTLAGLALAWLADRTRTAGLLVPVVVLPTVVAGAAVAVAWRLLVAFRPAGTAQVGLLNQVLAVPGLDPVAWASQTPLNTVLLAGAQVWVQTGVAMVVLSAAINRRVPTQIRDAAHLDGASELQVFRHITVPSIRGAVALAAVSAAVVAVRVFDLVVVATDGQYATGVLGTEAVVQGVRGGDTGAGAAAALAMLVLVAPFAVWAVVRRRRRAPEGSA